MALTLSQTEQPARGRIHTRCAPGNQQLAWIAIFAVVANLFGWYSFAGARCAEAGGNYIGSQSAVRVIRTHHSRGDDQESRVLKEGQDNSLTNIQCFYSILG